MNNSLISLYEEIKNGVPFKKVINQIPKPETVTVENVLFEIAIVPVPQNPNTEDITTEKIPGTSYSLPLIPLVILPGISNIEALEKDDDVLNALKSDKWISIFKGYNVLGYGLKNFGINFQSKSLKVSKFIFEVDEIFDKYLESSVFQSIHSRLQNKDIDVKGGYWFDNNGSFYNIKDAGSYSSKLSPFKALSKFVHKIFPYYPAVKDWISTHNSDSSQSNLDWWKGLATKMIKEEWNLVWEGEIYTSISSFSGLKASMAKIRNQLLELDWPENLNVKVINIYNTRYNDEYTWKSLIFSKEDSESGNLNDLQRKLNQSVENDARFLSNTYKQYFKKTSEKDSGKTESKLTESRLVESMNYDQLVAATKDYWPTRFKTVQYVKNNPPSLVLLKDGDLDLSFFFRCEAGDYPKGSGRFHDGFIKFFPNKNYKKADEKEDKSSLGKLKSWWKGVRERVKGYFNKEVPKNIFSTSDLRKMKCKVSCDCEDFKYRFEMANVYHDASVRKYSNGARPKITNKHNRPGLCKHLLACLKYLYLC